MPPSPRRPCRLGWLYALVAITWSCAHNPPGGPELASGGPLPRFCTADECAVVMSHNVDIESCECAARQYDETLGARLDMVFAVPAGGGKAQVAIGRAIGTPSSLQRCVVDRAGAWSFPAPAGGATRFRTGIIFAPDDHGACPPGPNASVRRATANKERLRAALAARQEEVKTCYRQALGNEAAASGRVVVTLIFNREGRVIQAQVDEATVHDERVESCITDHAYAWPMPQPAPPGVVTVTYPFTLVSEPPTP